MSETKFLALHGYTASGELYAGTGSSSWQLWGAPPNGMHLPEKLRRTMIDFPVLTENKEKIYLCDFKTVKKEVFQIYVKHHPVDYSETQKKSGTGIPEDPFLDINYAVEQAVYFVKNTCFVLVQIVVMEGSSRFVLKSGTTDSETGSRIILGSTDGTTYFDVEEISCPFLLISQVRNAVSGNRCSLFPWGYDPRFITSRTFVFRKTPGDKTLVTLDYFIGRRYYLDDRRSFVIKNATKISYEESEVVDEAIEENNICKVYWYNRGFATTYAEDTKSLFKNIQYTGEDIRVTWSDNSATLFRRSEEKEWQAENVYPPDLRYYKKCRLYTNNSLTDKNIMFVFSGTYMRKKTQTIIRNGEWRSYKSVITNDKNEYISDGGDVIVYVPEETGDGYVEKKIATLDLFYKYKVVEEPCGVMWHIQNATEIYTNHLIDSSCAIDTHKLADNATVSATIIRALHMYNCQFNGYVDARTYDNESYKGTVCNSIVSTEDVRFRPIIGSNYIYGCTVQNAIINQSSEYKHLYELRNSDIRNSVFAVRPDTVTNCHIIQNDYDTPWTATSVGLQINKLIDSTIIVNMPKEEFTDFRGVMISGLASNSTVYLNGSMEFKKRYSDNTYYATYLQKNVAVSNLTSYNNVLITLVEPENEEWLNCAVTYCCDIAQVTPTDQTKCIVGCRMYKSGTLCTNISCDDM